MPNNTQSISRTIKGMTLDFHPLNMDDISYGYVLNAVVEDFDGNGFPVMQNEPSNLKCTNFPVGYKVAGFINVVEQSRIIWFLVNSETGGSEIGESQLFQNCRDYASDGLISGGCDDCQSVRLSEDTPLENIKQNGCCVYRTITNSSCLNFSMDHPVTGVYRIDDCDLSIFFTDGYNPRRWMTFEYTAGSDDPISIKKEFHTITGYEHPPCEVPIYSTVLDCNKINIQPNLTTPCIDFVDLVSGGSLKAGSYQFFIAYADEDGTKLSSYISGTNPIPVRTRDITFDTDYPTDRAIALDILNVDRFGPHQYYKLVVGETINNFTAFYEVGTFPITQTRVVYSGNNDAQIKIDEGEVFGRVPFFKTASSITSANGVLFWGGISEYSKINVQRIANNVHFMWQTTAIPEPVFKKARNSTKYRGYMRDEVYPLGLVFILDNGDETSVGHVPGRASVPSDLEIISNSDVFTETNCVGDVRNKRWQVYNTATITGGNLSIYNECEESCYQYGEFAYWESTDKYPNDPKRWGTLCGQNIRFPKFPDSSVTHIHNHQDEFIGFNENNLVFPIGVRVDHDSVRAAIATAVTEGAITQAEADRIVGYRVVRGNRFNHKSVQAKGIVYDVNQYARKEGGTAIDQQPVYFANYPYNDLRSNPFVTDQFNNYDNHNDPEGDDLAFTFSKRYTFHSPDTHFNEPSVGTELKFETAEYGQAEGYYTKSKQQAKQKLLSDAAYALAITGGIVAAMMRVEEKECVEYTVRSDSKMTQQDSTIDSSVNGNTPVGNVTGSSPGAIITTPIQVPFTANGNATVHHGEQKDVNSTSEVSGINAPQPWYNSFGLDLNNASGQLGSDWADKKVRTCKGTRNQYFNNPTLNGNPMGAILGATGALIGAVSDIADFVRVVLEEMNIILDLMKSLVPYRDWMIQYNSVGKYNNYREVANSGNKRRKIANGAYLKSENSLINEEVDPISGDFEAIRFNNWHRETSLYLKYAGADVPTASDACGVTDNSRTPLNDAIFGCKLDRKGITNISAYYVSMKNSIPDQYGSIFNVEYLPTGSCAYPIDTPNTVCQGVYGGDTFIGRMSLKTKVPYFTATPFKLPAGTEWNFSDYPNLGFPRHYFDSTTSLGSEIEGILDLLNPVNLLDNLGRPKSIRDCSTNKFFYQNGYIYVYHYGIPSFLVESDVNVEYRYAENLKEKAFYPVQSDLDYWLQEENVPISEDNFYAYNRDYSKQNHETPLLFDPIDTSYGLSCETNFSNRIIYGEGGWLTYKANDKYEVPLQDGKLVSIEGIEDSAVLIRTTNNSSVIPAFSLIATTGGDIQVGNGSIFKNKPQQFAVTTLGYIGTQHRGILHTEYGHIWADAKRGQVFVVSAGGKGVDEISKEGMKNWFKENLPFRVLRDFRNFPEQDIDNAFNGVGLIYAFDKRYNRFLITKKDFKLKNPAVKYDPATKQFYTGEGSTRINIKLGDKRYFADASWTLSYNFFTKTWVSVHSYKPNYYIDFIDSFGSGNEDGLWMHGLTNASYQVFYGKLQPFIVENFWKFEGPLRNFNSIEFDTEVRRYQNEYDYTVKSSAPGFNKAVIYNDKYNSGQLNLVKVNKNDLSSVGVYPIRNLDNWEIELSLSNYKWRFNQFYNLVKDGAEIPLWLHDANNLEKTLNKQAFNYQKNDFSLSRIKGQWFKTRMINDKWSNYKIISKFSFNNQTTQFK